MTDSLLRGVLSERSSLYVQAGVLHAYFQWRLANDAILVALAPLPLPLLRASRGAPPGAGP